MASSTSDKPNHRHQHCENNSVVTMTMTTTEEFDNDVLGKHLPTATLDFERWQLDRLKTAATINNDPDTGLIELTHRLTTEESFPSHLEVNLVPGELDREDVVDNQSERVTTVTLTTPTPVPTQKSFRKWKTKKVSTLKEIFSGFADKFEEEAATCIRQGIHCKILSQAPSMYSLLRAWVLEENNRLQPYDCLPKRKSLLDYAASVRCSAQLNESTNAGLAHKIAAVVIPPIDILDWLKIRHLVGESTPYPLYTLERLHNARKRKNWLKASLRRNRVERARQSLAVKGIIL
jgi:hypothetical protein